MAGKQNQVIHAVAEWALRTPSISALILIGSHARGDARDDSDIDFVVITEKPDYFSNSREWTTAFGPVTGAMPDVVGILKSIRVFFENGVEVDFAFASADFASVDPVDAFTFQLISGGAKVLLDRDGSIEKLISHVQMRGRV